MIVTFIWSFSDCYVRILESLAMKIHVTMIPKTKILNTDSFLTGNLYGVNTSQSGLCIK